MALNSPYLDWFIIRGWPLRAYPSDARHPPNYDCWWGLPALPKFNIRNPGVREYLLEVARHWIAFGIDGWRLDVPTEIDDDQLLAGVSPGGEDGQSGGLPLRGNLASGRDAGCRGISSMR